MTWQSSRAWLAAAVAVWAGLGASPQSEDPQTPTEERRGKATAASAEDLPRWAAFEAEQLEEARAQAGRAYLEFLRVEDMNAGLYVLPAGATDGQSPHPEDEIYYTLSGRGKFRVGERDLEVRPGSVLYVAAGQEHRFHSIEEDLELLVVFAAGR